MKTTVKLDATRALVIEPAAGGVRITFKAGGFSVADFPLTSDTAGAVLFAVEQVLETQEARRAA